MSVENAAAYRERLEQILARREFRALPREGLDPGLGLPEVETPSFLTWLAQQLGAFWDWIRELLDRLFRKAPAPEAPAEGLSGVSEPLALALGLLAVGLLTLVILRMRRAGRSAAAAEPLEAAGPVGEAMPDALARPADAWARFADEFRRQGQWRLALRALYLRILVLLHERGAIHYERQRTNGEYATVLAAGPAGEPFGRLTLLFDQAWYGNKPFDEAGFTKALEWTRAVDRATAPGQGAP